VIWQWLPAYVLRRLLLAIPLVFLVTLCVFLLIELVPGGPVAAMAGAHPLTPVTITLLKARFHLDEPIWDQYVRWLSHVVRLNLGQSILTTEPVLSAIRARLDISLLLNSAGIALAICFGAPLGILAALKRGARTDRFVVTFGILFGTSPPFVIAIGAVFFFGLKLGWFPIFGDGSSSPGDRIYHLALPALVLGVHGMAFIMRITRAAMLESLDKDYVAFARARGIAWRRIILVYGVRNALIPVVTASGLLIVNMLTASVFVESVFGLPGLGGLLVTSVQNVDIPVIQGLVLVIAVWIILANIVIDVLYVLIDPRVAFGRVAA
jgi:peptide/nickel transport system permease protein